MLTKATKIAGVIYPSPFQMTELIPKIYPAFPPTEDFHYKNLELGVWNERLMTNDRKRIWGVIDGQIYNASELRKELQELGFLFTQHNDAELIVHAYDAWGDNFLKRLNGPFALALFDEEKEILMIALDRLGQKSLYWASQGQYWLFSTDIKELLATGLIPQTPAIESLASFLYFGFIPQDLSPIQGINKLLPGNLLKVDLKRQVFIEQYWSLSQHFEKQTSLSIEEVYDRFGALLEDSVKISIPKGETVGTQLSGYLGSSSLAWFLTHEIPRKDIRSYTPIFEDPHSKELEDATATANLLNISQTNQQIKPELILQELPKMLWYLNEPIADPLALQTWYFAKLAAQDCQTVVVDLGWEEMLAGHSRYFAAKKTLYPKPPLAFYLAKLPSFMLNAFVIPLFSLFNERYKFKILRNIELDSEQVAYLMESALFKGKSRKKVSPGLFQAFDSEVFTQRFHRFSSPPGSINPSIYFDAKTKLPDCTLLQYEKLISPYGLKIASPFLDYRLVEFLAQVPIEIKFESNQPGILLHRLMQHLCRSCPEFPERRDLFSEIWCNDPNFRRVFMYLQRGRLVEEGIISSKWIKQKLNYPYLIPRTFRQLWSILVLEIWFRLYINRPINVAASELSTEELLKQ